MQAGSKYIVGGVAELDVRISGSVPHSWRFLNTVEMSGMSRIGSRNGEYEFSWICCSRGGIVVS